jgi:lipopolysaccharide transport system ATP-binding protein
MTRTVIQADNLGKEYCRGLGDSSGLLRDALAKAVRSPGSFLRRERAEKFWALRNVSLEVNEGEVLGLIGRNGSGKTTLLKILSRVTRPSEGWAEIYGRVGSLLEVGTGFHPELTGRENIYLSGAILGMGKQEITRKFDEIVTFAELEKFVSTPVKHYSSGMYVRLAFAVAAHLEPEILLVDEVLAVGDIRFQKKCLGKMEDVARTGRTVILVSHNMGAINALSTRVVLLKEGGVVFDGSATQATAMYYAESLELASGGESLSGVAREGNGKARFSSFRFDPLDNNGNKIEVAYPGCDAIVELHADCKTDVSDCNVAMVIYDVNGYRLIDVNTAQKNHFVRLEKGQNVKVEFTLRKLLLKPGKYFVGLWLGRHTMETIDHIEHAATLDIMEGESTSRHSVIFPGVYLCEFEYRIS